MSDRPSEQFSEQPLPPLRTEAESEARDAQVTARQVLIGRIADLREQGLKGANWFFWVAGLSIVNSVIMQGGGDLYFVVGLGVTLIVDGITKAVGEQNPEMAMTLKIVAVSFAILVAAVVAVFGWLARKGILAIFVIGMFLYLLDGLLFLMLQDLMSVAFHGFALFWMWSGFSAFRKMHAAEMELRDQLDVVPQRYTEPDEIQ
jgi:hypothetical protein